MVVIEDREKAEEEKIKEEIEKRLPEWYLISKKEYKKRGKTSTKRVRRRSKSIKFFTP